MFYLVECNAISIIENVAVYPASVVTLQGCHCEKNTKTANSVEGCLNLYLNESKEPNERLIPLSWRFRETMSVLTEWNKTSECLYSFYWILCLKHLRKHWSDCLQNALLLSQFSSNTHSPRKKTFRSIQYEV